jgi:lipid II:glycine glycyltransferase (peptidoglycan interpeptide bridge formation enzyme)
VVIVQNKQVEAEQWNDLLEDSFYYSPFQTEKAYKLFNSAEGLGADVFAVEDNGAYKCLVVVTVHRENGLKSFFSGRGIIYGGLVIRHGGSGYVDTLLNAIDDYYRNKLIYIEIRNYFDFTQYHSLLTHPGWKHIPWLNIQNEISSNNMLSEFSSSRKRQILKALRNGASWEQAGSSNEIKEFYSILSDLYTNKIKKPLIPLPFFLNAFDTGFAIFLLVKYSGRIIGGIMLAIIPDRAAYEFYVCGLDSEFRDQYPSVMATWAAIEYAQKNDIPLFDFMGAGSPDKEYGVREFKKRFGGVVVEHSRYLKVFNPVLYMVGKMGLKVMQLTGKLKFYGI